MSQYQLTLILLAMTSLGLFAAILCFEVFPSSAFSMALDATLSNSKYFNQQMLLEVMVLFTVGCLALHLLGLAWVRIHRSTINNFFRASLTLAAVLMPLVCYDFFRADIFTSSQTLGEPTSSAASNSNIELVIEENHPDEPSIRVYTVPFHQLYKEQLLSHERWDFTLEILEKLNHAGIGGPLAKLRPTVSREERFLTASAGIAGMEALRMFHLPRHQSGGMGAKVKIIPKKGATPSENTFLLYAGDSLGRSLPAQSIPTKSQAYKISLRPQHRNMEFSWLVERDGDCQFLHILDAETGQILRSFQLDSKHQPVYRGYKFTPKAHAPENYDPQSILLEIEYHPVPKGIRSTTIYLTVMLTFIFLIGRFGEILIQRSKAEGDSP